MSRQQDAMELTSAVAGTLGALGVAGRYAAGGVGTVRARLRRAGLVARAQGRRDAERTARRAVVALRILRGPPEPPPVRQRPFALAAVAVAGAALGAVVVVEVWHLLLRRAAAGTPPEAVPPEPDRPTRMRLSRAGTA
jgi:hypothetical protein